VATNRIKKIVTGPAHDLYLKFTGKGDSLFTFDWWEFTPAAGKVRK